MKQFALALALPLVAACTQMTPTPEVPDVDAAAEDVAVIKPAPRPSTAARTVDQFDTTSKEERAAAVAVATSEPAGATELGLTTASLGNPAEPGFWMETPLVSAVTKGRVDYPANGRSVAVELRPIAGEAGSGSRLSLPAMRLLDAPLTGLPDVKVFKL